MFAVCLPAIFHLFKRGWKHGPRAMLHADEFSHYGAASDRRHYGKSNGVSNNSFQRLHEAKAGTTSIDEHELGDIPQESIIMRRDVKVGVNV